MGEMYAAAALKLFVALEERERHRLGLVDDLLLGEIHARKRAGESVGFRGERKI
jgi:hypothetical protein